MRQATLVDPPNDMELVPCVETVSFEKTLTLKFCINYKLIFDDRKKSKCVRQPLEILLITRNWSQVLRHRQFRENVDPQILHKIIK